MYMKVPTEKAFQRLSYFVERRSLLRSCLIHTNIERKSKKGEARPQTMPVNPPVVMKVMLLLEL